ncbi:MAG: PilZ domain-containing protein [Phycisphaerae bacterium]
MNVCWSGRLEQLQRRTYERVAPPRDTVIAVRFWREGATSDKEAKRVVRHGQMEDLSAGGMRLKVADVSDLEIDTLYKCVFSPRSGAQSLVLEATLKHHEAVENRRASLGFQFIGLETTPQGRRTLDQLARIVKRFQRVRNRARQFKNLSGQ